MTTQQEQLLSMEEATQRMAQMKQQMELVVKGKSNQIDLVLTCLFAGGHILIEDNPGTGKTVLARTLAKTIITHDQHTFKRIQFTPDLLPMDLIGTHIFDSQAKDFVFKKGPLFCNILLADEINRASPKVQSALLECMAEGQITAGDQTYLLEDVFFTIATQNPIEMEGTYPLPAAQLDRFFMKIQFGYVDEATELNILSSYQNIAQELTTLDPVMSITEIKAIQKLAQEVKVHDELIKTVAILLQHSRNSKDLSLGASTRAGIAIMKCLRAYALLQGRSYVTEQDLMLIIPSVLQHRLVFHHAQAEENWLNQELSNQLERLRKIK